MIKQETGFTLVELMITMVVFVLVLAAGAQIFTGLLTQFKQQSKMAETNIEAIVGLETLRRDIEHAGYGLPWTFQNAINYNEAASAPASNYNDAPINPPRGIISGNKINYANVINDSDYLIIKAITVARNETCEKWTTLQSSPTPFSDTYNPRVWSATSENLQAAEKVIVISLGGTTDQRMLIMNNAAFFDQYSNVGSSPWTPMGPTDIRIVYGVNPDTDLSMPFNRADYFVSTTNVPLSCAQNTGVLEKAVVNQNDGNLDLLPLLDCVADMQVVFGMDTDADGAVNCYVNNLADVLAPVNAQNIREQVREVRVYILAHEGQYDRDFTYNPPSPPSTIRVGEPEVAISCTGAVLGRDLDFSLSGITNWQNYRWKAYTLVVSPDNLR